MTDLRELLQSAAGSPRVGVDLGHVQRRARVLAWYRRGGAATIAIVTAVAVLIGIRVLPARDDLSGPAPLPATGPVRPGDYLVSEFLPPLRLTVPSEGWKVTARSWGSVTLTNGDGTLVVDRWSTLYSPEADVHGRVVVGGEVVDWFRQVRWLTVSDPVKVIIDGQTATQLDMMVAEPLIPAPAQCDQRVSCALLAEDPNGWLWLNTNQSGRLIVLPTDVGTSFVAIFIKSGSNNRVRFLDEVAPLLASLQLGGN